jgi:hypothetical protein
MKKELWMLVGLSLLVGFLSYYNLLIHTYSLVSQTSLIIYYSLFLGFGFILQPLLASFIEESPFDRHLVTLGGGLLVLGLLIPEAHVSLILAGLGFAAFNSSALKIILRAEEKDYPFKLFLASEIFGVGLGSLFHVTWLYYFFFAFFCVLIILHLFVRYYTLEEQAAEDLSQGQENGKKSYFIYGLLGLACLLFGFSQQQISFSFFVSAYGFLFAYLALGAGVLVGIFLRGKILNSSSLLASFLLLFLSLLNINLPFSLLCFFFALGLMIDSFFLILREEEKGSQTMSLSLIFLLYILGSFISYLNKASFSLPFYLNYVFLASSLVFSSIAFLLHYLIKRPAEREE